MKLLLISILVFLVLSIFLMGQSKWHLNRNQYNQLPTGTLILSSDAIYTDEAGLRWELQPHIKNKFHQPDRISKEVVMTPYQPVLKNTALKMDPANPNLKFLCVLENGASYEAILQPNGQYLTTGKKQGTYNYGHPSGILGYLKHIIWDVLPHFINANYQ